MVPINLSYSHSFQQRFTLDALSRHVGRSVLALGENWRWRKRLRAGRISQVQEIFTYTTVQELRSLYNLAASCPPNSTALEIGSHLGASSCYIAAALATIKGRLLCVDTWNNETMPEGEQDTFATFLRHTSSVSQVITPIRKWSKDLEYRDIQTPLSLVFIDGDHSYTAAKADFERVQQWLSPTGIIAFHDFGSPEFEGVSRVVGEALASGRWIMSGKVDSLVWITPAQWQHCPCLEGGEA